MRHNGAMSNHLYAQTPAVVEGADDTLDAGYLTVDVVVDAASLGYAVDDAAGVVDHPLVGFNLFPLVDTFARRGMAVRTLLVACPQAVVTIDEFSDPARGRAKVDQWREWLADQTEQLAVLHSVQFGSVPGAFDGVREVGVDDLVAWMALRCAGAIADDGDPAREAVVVVSSDTDMWHLSPEASPVRLFVAGAFTNGQIARLIGHAVPFIQLPASELAGYSTGNDELPKDEVSLVTGVKARASGVRQGIAEEDMLCVHTPPEGGTFQASSPLNRMAPARDSGTDDVLAAANTIVIADPYGLHLAARQAIGVGGLARPDAIRGMLLSMGWDWPVAVLAAVPDLSEPHLGTGVLPEELVAAWWDRDSELDELADEIDGDTDPLTQARRAELRVTQHGPGGTNPELRVTIKRLSTGMVTDLWRATRWSPGTNVVVVTEDPELSWLLAVLPIVSPEVTPPVRLGLHTRRLSVIDGPQGDPLKPGPVVVLTEQLAAQIVGAVDRSYARSLRVRLADLMGADVQVESRGVEPETGGLVVRLIPIDDEASAGSVSGEEAEAHLEAVDAVLHAGGGIIRGDVEHLATVVHQRGGVVRLRFDPTVPCAVPDIVIDAVDYDDDEVEAPREARVVAREGHRLWVDIDFDRVADFSVATGHDTTTYRPDDMVTVQLLAGGPRRWALTGPGIADSGPAEPHVLLRILKHEDGGARAVDPETDDTGWLEPLPGEDQVRDATNVIAVELGRLDDGTVQWMAVSSGLTHLDEMMDRYSGPQRAAST